MHFSSLTAPPTATPCPITTCLHSYCQCFGSPEAAQEKRDQQRTNLHSAFDEVTLVEAHSARRLSLDEALNLSDKNRHELKGDDKDHHYIVYWQSDSLQRREQNLGTIGQIYQRGSEHEHRGEVVKEKYADHNQCAAPDTFPRYIEHAPLPDDLWMRRWRDVEQYLHDVDEG